MIVAYFHGGPLNGTLRRIEGTSYTVESHWVGSMMLTVTYARTLVAAFRPTGRQIMIMQPNGDEPVTEIPATVVQKLHDGHGKHYHPMIDMLEDLL